MRVHGAFFDEGIIFWCRNLFPAFLRGPSSKGVCPEYSPFQDENRGPKHGCRLEARVSARRVRHASVPQRTSYRQLDNCQDWTSCA
jgi:hypothetical protein